VSAGVGASFVGCVQGSLGLVLFWFIDGKLGVGDDDLWV